ncbi:MAG: SsrA-binding protein [candidate division TM6 bacterium GW2011_GWF2_30_66]|jgi:SsrA-binding protein|nr:MAG: SsrA-binding protein [candidate division TM6 bacterium GW2011_GWF2_30_66]
MLIVKNKKAFFDYEVLDSIEAGIVLSGDEVKSLRAGKVSLVGAFATIHGGEIYMINCNITPYSHAYDKSDEKSTRRRKLLLHRKEIDKLTGDISKKGVTLVVLKLYFKDGKIKAEIGICKHKKAASKKSALKERDIKRETTRELRGKYKF